MDGKLIKTDGSYCLIIIHERIGNMIIATDNKDLNKMLNYPYNLSFKNCQAIENGYDLDEFIVDCVVDKLVDMEDVEDFLYAKSLVDSYKEGFQKALEILGDKKFTENDMRKAYGIGFSQHGLKSFYSLIQSLQQTEWDVSFNPEEKDSEGCLVLKRL